MLPGLRLFPLSRRTDPRGAFTTTWSTELLGVSFVQDNESVSRRGVLRGMHLQRPTAQGKLVRVVAGTIFDVAVDLRPESPTFGRWEGLELTEDRAEALWIPRGFAHGFVTLSERSIVAYKVDAPWVPGDERVLAWDDPHVGIVWPIAAPILNARDAGGEGLQAFR